MKPLRPLAVLITALLLPLAPVTAAAAAEPVTAVTVDEFGDVFRSLSRSSVFATDRGDTVRTTVHGAILRIEAGRRPQVVQIAPPTGQLLAAGSYATLANATADKAGLQLFGDTSCGGSGRLDVAEVSYSGTSVVSLSAAYSCVDADRRVAGELRLASGTAYRAASTVSSVSVPDGIVGQERRQTVLVRSAGTEALTLGQAVFDGLDAGLFRILDDACSGQVVTTQCSLVVAITDSAGGYRGTRLVLPDNTRLGSRKLWVTSLTLGPVPAPSLRTHPGHDGVGLTVSAGTTPNSVSATNYRVERQDANVWTSVGTRSTPGLVIDFAARPGLAESYRAVAVSPSSEAASNPVTATRPDRAVPTAGSQSLLSLDRGFVFGDEVSSETVVPTSTPSPGFLSLSGPNYLGRPTHLVLQYTGDLPPGDHQLAATGDISSRPRLIMYVRGIDDCFTAGVLHVQTWAVRADGTPDVIDADVSATCQGEPAMTGHVRYRADRGFTAATASPARVDAGGTVLGKTSPSTRVTVTSAGPDALVTGTPRLTGPDAGDFRVTATTCGTTVGDCTVDVAAAPVVAGTRKAFLEVPDNTLRGRRSVGLLAFGVAPPKAPQHVTAGLASARAALTWSPPANDGGSRVTGYRIHRVAPDSSPVLVDTLAPHVQQWRTSQLTVGASYWWTVTAVNAAGVGAASRLVGGVVPRRQYVASVYDPARDLSDVAITGGGSATPLRVGPDGDQVTPTVSRDGKTLAWAQDLGSGYAIAVSPIAGGAQRILTHQGPRGSDVQPAFSPNGTLIAFTRYVGDVPVLAVVPRAGGDVVLVPNSRGLYRPTWTADGKRLVAGRVGFDLTTGADREPYLEVIGVDGSRRAKVAGSAGAVDPAVSPDGARIAFVRTGATSAVALLPLAGGKATVLATPSGEISSPSWAPDGASVVFTVEPVEPSGQLGNGFIAEVRTDGRDFHAVTTTPELDLLDAVVTDTDTQSPKVALAALARASTASQVRVSWTGSDTGSGVASYDVRIRKAAYNSRFGAHAYPAAWQGLRAGSVALTTARGVDQCVSVRARDKAGNASGWTSERCTASPLDDRSLKASAGWTRATQPAAFLKTETVSRQAGATLTLPSSQAVRGWLVATTCSTCGAVRVTIGGRLLGTVSTYSAATRRQVLLPLPGAGTLRSGAVVLTTTSSRPVYLDGLGLAWN